jgi:glycosyltransferase involved in cell wall biosynthesis
VDSLLSPEFSASGYGFKPHRVIPLGVDLSAFRSDAVAKTQIRVRLGWKTEGPPVVGYLGRFVPEKGVGFLTRVLDRLSTPWRALFVGAGPMEAALRRWARSCQSSVRVVTGIPHDGVPNYLNAMDLLCAPSQTSVRWREQFGRMLIEAFACGVPVIASDSGEIPHVVGDAGIILSEHDECAWIEKLGELIENPDLRAELSRRGLERARTRYSWPNVARQHLEFFDQLLASG